MEYNVVLLAPNGREQPVVLRIAKDGVSLVTGDRKVRAITCHR